MTKESTGIGHVVDSFDCVLNVDKESVEAPPQIEAPP